MSAADSRATSRSFALAREEFYLITGTSQTVRDSDWITRNIRPGEQAELVDVTNAFGVLGVMGPNSRALLSRVTDSRSLQRGVSVSAPRRRISMGMATVRAVRITYVGELGWELHVPIEQAAPVYDTLMQAGQRFRRRERRPLRHQLAATGKRLSRLGRGAFAGRHAARSRPRFCHRLEQALPRTRRAVASKSKAAVKRQLVTFVVEDPEPVLWGSEPILRDGKPVGYTTSGILRPHASAAPSGWAT